MRSFPSSSGILKGSFLMLSYRFYRDGETDVRSYWAAYEHEHRQDICSDCSVVTYHCFNYSNYSTITTLRSQYGGTVAVCWGWGDVFLA